MAFTLCGETVIDRLSSDNPIMAMDASRFTRRSAIKEPVAIAVRPELLVETKCRDRPVAEFDIFP